MENQTFNVLHVQQDMYFQLSVQHVIPTVKQDTGLIFQIKYVFHVIKIVKHVIQVNQNLHVYHVG